MNLIIKKTPELSGTITVPSSKSQSVRAMLFALLACGTSGINNILESDDTRAALMVCEQLGADIKQINHQLIFNSAGIPLSPKAHTLFTDNSGITTRFIMPLLGLRYHTTTPILLDCNEQMRARPIQSLVDALNQLGMDIGYHEKQGQLPLSIKGPLLGGNATVDGITSQYLSALLIALPLAAKPSKITVYNLHERPYVEMTLQWLAERNIQVEHKKLNSCDIFYIQGQQHYDAFTMTIPGDFSSASYLIAASVLIPGQIILHGLNPMDMQGDKRLIELLNAMGADIRYDKNTLVIQGGTSLKGIAIDANDIPDLLPTLAVVGTRAQGKTTLYNVAQARIKETDRIHSMAEGLRRLGATIKEQADGMTIYESDLVGCKVNGYDDHRTVMAFGLAGLIADGMTIVSNAKAINKTFPTFVECIRALGANIEVMHD